MSEKILNDETITAVTAGRGPEDPRPRDIGFDVEKWELKLEEAETARENAVMEKPTIFP